MAAPKLLMHVIPAPPGTRTLLTGGGPYFIDDAGEVDYACGSCHKVLIEGFPFENPALEPHGFVYECGGCGAFNQVEDEWDAAKPAYVYKRGEVGPATGPIH